MRRLIGLLLILLLSTPALADLAGERDDLVNAIDARVTALGPNPATATERKEARKLAQARDDLVAYSGGMDLADAPPLANGLLKLYKSGTVDVTVLAEAKELLTEVCEHIDSAYPTILHAVAILGVPRQRRKVTATLGRVFDPSSFPQTCAQLADTDPEEAAKLIRKTLVKLDKIGNRVQRFGGKQNCGVPNPWILRQLAAFSLINNGDKDIRLKQIDIDMDVWDNNGNHTYVTGKAKDLNPESWNRFFKNTVPPGTWYDLLPYFPPVSVRFQGALKVKTNKGTFCVAVDFSMIP